MFKHWFRDKMDSNLIMFNMIAEHWKTDNNLFVMHMNDNDSWKCVKFLNKRGLIKYFPTKNKNVLDVVPTLFCLYLTKKKKYGIEKAYYEAVELFNMIGEEINGRNKTNKVLSKRTANT